MIIKYMTVDGKFFDDDLDLIKVITGDNAGYYITQESLTKMETKSLNSNEVTE